MASEVVAFLFGLTAAACWGAGDFSGGLAAKRSNVFIVVIISQLIGITFLLSLVLLTAEQFPPLEDMFWGCLAGLSGGAGLIALYRGLAGGHMGIVAPVSAIVTAIVSVTAGILLEGLPAAQQLAGFGVALIAVWFVTRSGDDTSFHVRDLGLPVVSGLGFGFFQIFIDRTSEGVILWPLVAVRIASLSMLFTVVTLTRQLQVTETGRIIDSKKLPVIALAGLFDSGGNAFFVLAAQTGRLDIAAILSALSPAGTVLLALFILKENLTGRQWFGIITAVIAVVLITS